MTTVSQDEHEKLKISLLAKISALTEQNNNLVKQNLEHQQKIAVLTYEIRAALDSYDKSVKEYHGAKVQWFINSGNFEVAQKQIAELQLQLAEYHKAESLADPVAKPAPLASVK